MDEDATRGPSPVTGSADTTVAAHHVVKRFGDRRSTAVAALDDVSLIVGSGARIGIVGESGSGKSTLARMLVGLDTPTSGEVTHNGRNLALHSRGDWLRFRRSVQLVAQDTTSSFDPRRTLRDAVRAPLLRLLDHSTKQADEEIDTVLHSLSVPIGLAARYPNEVSGGQRQRFAIARALVVRPRILVCDEVVSALDVSVQGTILNLLKRYCVDHGAGMVFVSHGLPATAFLSEHLVVMHRGRIVEQGPTPAVIHTPDHEYTRMLLRAHATPGSVGARASDHVDDRFARPPTEVLAP